MLRFLDHSLNKTGLLVHYFRGWDWVPGNISGVDRQTDKQTDRTVGASCLPKKKLFLIKPPVKVFQVCYSSGKKFGNQMTFGYQTF